VSKGYLRGPQPRFAGRRALKPLPFLRGHRVSAGDGNPDGVGTGVSSLPKCRRRLACNVVALLASLPAEGSRLENVLRLDQRVRKVYWRHRIWPEERLDPKSSLDAEKSDWKILTSVSDFP
jgi:hypothetical protein